MPDVSGGPRPSGPALRHPALPGVVWEATSVARSQPLHRAEVEHIQHSVPKRRDEFATVRACAGRALAELGYTRPTMTPGPRGEPQWPEGVVGSMTHTDGYYAAAVAPRHAVAALGIDAEQHEALPDRVFDLVASPAERDRARELASSDGSVAWDRLVFSAKEAIYKTWHPQIGTWLDFGDVEVDIGPGGTFAARLVGTGNGWQGAELLRHIAGRWWADIDHIVTAAVVPATPTLGSQRDDRR